MSYKFLIVVVCVSLCYIPEAKADPETHDGFYLQLATGLGYYTSATDTDPEQSFSGLTLPFSLLLGGSVIPGLVIGGGFFIDYAPSPSYEVGGQDSGLDVDVSQFMIGIGALVDYYIFPERGLHFQGFIGWGGLETSADGNAGGSDPTGLVMYLGGGYDWWIGDEWSLGVLGRLVIAPLSMDDVGFMTIEPDVLATITYH